MKGCINHKGTIDRTGYGRVYFSGKRIAAHRAEWIKANGPIPPKLVICHKCDNRLCINVDHLFIGTQKDNMTDAMIKDRMASRENKKHRNSRKTHCPNGHEYKKENLTNRADGKRNCKLCDRAR